MRVFATRTYERAIRKLIPAAAREEMEAAIVADSEGAPLIRGTVIKKEVGGDDDAAHH